jgi:NosR/NirI family transcriptional regulator, nitrous oxide reductase regulator
LRSAVWVWTLTSCLFAASVSAGESSIDAAMLAQLRRVFPQAASFSVKEGQPPYFKAFGPSSGAGAEPTLLGYVWWTTDVEPLERGYDGPIKMLVGMDVKGILTGAIVTEDHEPYGDFSVETPGFAAQFKGKDIRDQFKVGVDIDAISRASISVSSASRAVRNSARRIARTYLPPPPQ